MPSKTVQHPLISRLKFKDKTYKNVILKDIGLIIGKNELRTIFSTFLRKNDEDNLRIMLDFDYGDFFELEEDAPFYLEYNPFPTLPFILDKIQEANSLNYKQISIYLQNCIKEWLRTELSNDGDIFSREVSHAINAVSFYQPEFAYQRLSVELKGSFELTEKNYHSRYYKKILNALANLAKNPKYFEFSATKLWQFASKEIQLSPEDKSDKALPHFASLFHNTFENTSISLKIRMEYLSKNISSAKYWPRKHILIKALSEAVDMSSFRDEEVYVHDPDLQTYVNFSIDNLMKYAVQNDSEGLSSYAQNKIHYLLGSSIDKIHIDYPFRIFRYYLSAKQQWERCPFLHIDNFELKINQLKKHSEVNLKEINLLERRLSQLKSFRDNSQRAFIADDFKLFLKAKKESKICEIDLNIDEKNNLELHERQSLAERLLFSKTADLKDISRSYPRCTYIVVSFGMVVSSKPHHPGGNHDRIFKTIPIKMSPRDGENLFGSSSMGAHAEEALYEYLLDEDNIKYHLTIFKQAFNIEDHRKIYAVVLDLHGTYDMCLSCSEKGYEFQQTFREKLLNILSQQKLITLTKYPDQLPIIIRYSSDLRYHYSKPESTNKQKGILSLVSAKNSGYNLENSPDNIGELIVQRDIKQFTPNFLLHGKDQWHSLWPSKNPSIDIKCLEPWSAFVSSYEYSKILSVEEKKFCYVKEGMNDYSVNALMKDVSNLTIRKRR